MIAEAAEPLPDLDDPAFGAAVRPLRRPPRRAARRGQPRHLRVLPRPRRDHAPADRAARLHHRRGRGGLARCGGGRPLRAASPRAGSRRAAVPALPDLDVAQHRCRGAHRLDARAQRERSRARAPGRLLRSRHLQHERLDRRRARLSRQGRSRGRGRGARALWLPDALAEGALRPMAVRCSRPASANASRR